MTFKVGDRVRWKFGGPITEAVQTVTEITERGFKWKLDEPVCIHPFFGSYQEGECYMPEMYEVVLNEHA